MGVRSTISNVLDRTLGPSIVRRLKQTEAAGRRRVINFLDVEARARELRRAQRAAEPRPSAEERRAELIEALGHRSLADSVNQEGLGWATNDPFVEHPPPAMTRHQVLDELHRLLEPRTYFEIGVRWGDSLALSRTRSIGVDPAFKIRTELNCDLRTFAETSDDFFDRADAFDHFAGRPIDLAFIDGMHLSDYALRDFINVEKHCTSGSVVVFDDVLPRNDLEGYRIRRTKSWAGDVYKIFGILRALRPDLVLVPLNTKPTGTLIVANLDPTSTVLDDAWAGLVDELTSPDPQSVPDEVLSRSVAADPERVLASNVWPKVKELRDGGATDFDEVWTDLNAQRPLWTEPAPE